jgi:hypothetical protein
MSLFRNLKNNPRFEKTLLLDPILSQMSPLDKFASHFVSSVLIQFCQKYGVFSLTTTILYHAKKQYVRPNMTIIRLNVETESKYSYTGFRKQNPTYVMLYSNT